MTIAPIEQINAIYKQNQDCQKIRNENHKKKMAFGKAYELPKKNENEVILKIRYILTEYLIPLISSYILLKFSRNAAICIHDFFDPDLTEYYYNPSPTWLSF